MNNAPIGIFDSGLGGLSVWRVLRRELPHESLYYFGDGLNCPYGPKDPAEVREYVDRAVAELQAEGVKMLVVACNAATAAAVDYLRGKYPFPIVGMEPAVKPAAESTRSGTIGILATAGTLGGELFRTTAAKYQKTVNIITAVGEGFVELVEEHLENTPDAVETVRHTLVPMLDAGADRIVLGCTHYPFLERAMLEVIGMRDVELIDPAPAIAKRIMTLLAQHDLAAGEDNVPEYRFFTAWDDGYLKRIEHRAAVLY